MLKTKKTLIKRIKISKTGKILKKQSNTGHLKEKWSTSRKHRKARIEEQTNTGHKKLFKKMLGKQARRIK
jgi:ribosomal protein L35